MMQMRQLDAFRKVMATGSVTLAAEALGISQPAVSRLLADLQVDIPVRLFDRRSGRIFPTREATLFLQYVDKAFVGMESLEQALKDIVRLKDSQIRVAAFPALSLRLLPELVKTLYRSYPEVRTSLQITDSQRVVDLVATHRADIGFATMPVENSGTEVVATVAMDCVCVLPTRHRLRRRAVIKPADLASEPLIALDPSYATSRTLQAILAEQGLTPHGQVECSSARLALDLVRSGMGLAIVDPLTAYACVDDQVVFRKFQPSVPFSFSLIRPSFSVGTVAVDALIDAFESLSKRFRFELRDLLAARA